MHFSRGALESSFSPFYLVHCHFVEHMLQTGEPHAYNAFKLAGHTPALVRLSSSPLTAFEHT